MRQFSRCTPGRSRGLWEQPVFVANQDERWCSWCSWNDTRSLSGETFPEVSHCEHNQTRPPCRERADSEFIQEPWQQTEGYCQGVELNVRMCVYGWLRNENGWKCVLLLNPFSPRLSVRKQPLNCLLCSFFTRDASRVAADEKATRLQTIRSGFKPTTSDMTNTWACRSFTHLYDKNWQITASLLR